MNKQRLMEIIVLVRSAWFKVTDYLSDLHGNEVMMLTGVAAHYMSQQSSQRTEQSERN